MTVREVWLKCVNTNSSTKVMVYAPTSTGPVSEGPIWAIPDRVQRGEVAQFRLCGLTDKGSATEVWMFFGRGFEGMKKFMVSLFIVALVLLIAGFVWGGYYIYFLLEDSPAVSRVMVSVGSLLFAAPVMYFDRKDDLMDG